MIVVRDAILPSAQEILIFLQHQKIPDVYVCMLDVISITETRYQYYLCSHVQVHTIRQTPCVTGHLYSILYYFIQLCYNPQVYQMSDKIRGRVLIINNKTFKNENPRPESEVDYNNLCWLFRSLRFDICKKQKDLTDLTAQVVLLYQNLSLR